MSDSDLQLLERYTRQHTEDAFAELVRRHVDLVFSAALRQVRSPQLAEEVAQSAFTDLARQAHRLTPDTVLSAWLYQVTRRRAIDVVRREARRQAREQAACELNAMNSAAADWTHIEPLLDEAMQELDDSDRAAVLLRYFENKSLRDVGQTLGTTEEAARKRVGRAVDRLRDCLARRGLAVGASGLAALLSANAVTAAPAGVAVAISTATALAGTTVASAATATATNTIVMTTLQKSVIAVALAAAVGTGVYQARQASRLRNECQVLHQQQAPLNEQLQQLQRERDEAKEELAAVQAQLARTRSGQNTGEVLRLRGQVGVLRQQLASADAKAKEPTSGAAKWMSDPSMNAYLRQAAADKVKSLYAPLFQELKLTPEQREKFGQLFGEQAGNFFAQIAGTSKENAGQSGAATVRANDSSGLEAQVRALLGEAGYARYQEFSREIPGRTTLGLLGAQLEQSQAGALSNEQGARLIQVVSAEPHELTSGIIGSPDMAFMGSQADIDNFLQRVAESNQRVLQQSAGFLSPKQLTALSTVLSNGINTRKLQGAALVQKH